MLILPCATTPGKEETLGVVSVQKNLTLNSASKRDTLFSWPTTSMRASVILKS